MSAIQENPPSIQPSHLPLEGFWKNKDIPFPVLKGKTVAMVGYGNQGRPQALNLKDSGVQVLVGLRPGSEQQRVAEADGFQVVSPAQAVAQSDIIMFMIPDEQIPPCCEALLRENPACFDGKYVGFAHGLSIHAQWVQFSDKTHVFLVAPKAQGRGVRQKYLENTGVPALAAVHQDPSQTAWNIALGYAAAIGCGRVGIFPTTFREETECDLFTEQTLLCGGLTELIKIAFETLVEQGYDPHTAWFECVYEVKLLADLIHEKGITGMREAISPAARFGDVTRGRRVIDGHVKATMAQILGEIQSQQFMDELKADAQNRYTESTRWVQADAFHPVESMSRVMLPLVHRG